MLISDYILEWENDDALNNSHNRIVDTCVVRMHEDRSVDGGDYQIFRNNLRTPFSICFIYMYATIK